MIKSELAHKDLSKTEKYLLILSTIGRPCEVSEIKQFAKEYGWGVGAQENPSPYLKAGNAVKTSNGWELTQQSEDKLKQLNLLTRSTSLTPFTEKLMKAASIINDKDTKRFLEEAIGCLQAKHFRAAIVLSWVGALWILYTGIQQKHASDFVVEAQARGYKSFQIKNTEDFSKIPKESIFLEIAEKIGAITKTERRELGDCLDRRNDAGHPNEFEPGEGIVAGHIEVLLKYIFSKV